MIIYVTAFLIAFLGCSSTSKMERIRRGFYPECDLVDDEIRCPTELIPEIDDLDKVLEKYEE